MARDVQTIQAEIDRARTALADAVDEITDRTNPKAVAERSKQTVIATVNEPKVKWPLIGVGALIVILLLRKLLR